jgi:hypothetical protein
VVAWDAQLVADTERVCFDFAAYETEMSLVRVEIVVDLERCIERAVLVEQSSFADTEDLIVMAIPSEVHFVERLQLLVSRSVHYLKLETALVGRSSAATGRL